MWDFLEEFRPLSDIENNGRDILKQHLDKILEFQRIYWKQRATIRWVKLEDENSNFYRTKATLNHRHNSIASLTDSNGNTVLIKKENPIFFGKLSEIDWAQAMKLKTI